jgi:hypothetical protein
MGAPSGAVAKLFFNPEVVAGTLVPLTTTAGLRPYFESLVYNRPVRTEKIAEIRGSSTYDETGLFAGPSELSGTLVFPLRYSAVHAVLMQWACGDMTKTGTSDPWTFTVKTSDDLPFASLIHHFPVGDAVTFDENQLLGCVATRMTLRGTTSGVVMCSIDFVGMSVTHTVTEDTTVPPDSSAGYSPMLGNLVLWNHASPAQLLVYPEAGDSTSCNITEWEVTIENPIDQTTKIGNTLAKSAPFRNDVRNVTSRITFEQDSVYTTQMLVNAWETSGDLYFQAVYTNPSTSYDWTFQVGNGYIIDPGGGTDGMGPQRQTVTIKHIHGASIGSWPNAHPFQAAVRFGLEKPTGSAYTDYSTIFP